MLINYLLFIKHYADNKILENFIVELVVNFLGNANRCFRGTG